MFNFDFLFNKKIEIVLIFIFSMITSLLYSYVTRYNCFWSDDFWFGRYMPDETIWQSLNFDNHGEGYLGLFIFKFLCSKLPFILNINPYDFMGISHGFIKGLFLSVIIYVVSKLFCLYNTSKKEFLICYIFLFFYINYFFVLFEVDNVMVSYTFYRYIFSQLFFCIFFNYVIFYLTSNQTKTNIPKLIAVCLCSYVSGTSSEIVFFTAALMIAIILIYKIFLILIDKIKRSHVHSQMLNLDINFYLPSFFLYLGMFLFTGSDGFKKVAAERGMMDIHITLSAINEYTSIFIKQCFSYEYLYWLLFIILFGFSFCFAVKRKEINKILLPFLFIICVLVVIYSLILCGKTYNHSYWIYRHSIIHLYKFMRLYPIIIYAGYLLDVCKNKKFSTEFFIIIVFLISMYNAVSLKITDYINNNPVKEQYINQYMYEKIVRFYTLQSMNPIIPVEIADKIPELTAEPAKQEKQMYFDYMIYKDKKILNYPYMISNTGFEQFQKNGGTFSLSEIENPIFSKLEDEKFILN